MKYKGSFGYVFDNKFKFSVSANSFSVVGGASRTINLNSTNDISITSELEQARQYKNITVFMPPSPTSEDMEVAVELIDCALKKTVLIFDFHVSKYSNGRMIEELNLVDAKATISKTPSIVANRSLMIEVSLPSAILTDAFYGTKGRWIKTVEM